MKTTVTFLLISLLLIGIGPYSASSQTSASIVRTKYSGFIVTPRILPAGILLYTDTISRASSTITETKLRYKKNGEVKKSATETRKYEYDAGEKLVRYTYYEGNKLKFYTTFHYSDSGYLLEAKRYDRKNKLEAREVQVFENGNLSEWISYDDSLKLRRRLVMKHNDMGKVTEYRRYKKNRIQYHYENEYYDNGDIKSSTSYNRRGKVVLVSNFECDPKGKIEEKKKDTATVCVSKTALEDGGRMEVYIRTNPNMEEIKTIYFYDSKDQLVKKERYYAGSDQIYRYQVSGYTDDGKYSRLVDTIYRKNGSPEKSWNEALVDGKIRKSFTEYGRNGEIKSRSNYEFEQDDYGRVIVRVVLGEDDRRKSMVRYTYN